MKCGESLSKVYKKMNGHHFNMLNCLLEEITDLLTMATSTWTSHTNYDFMDILSCHVCKGIIHNHTNQNGPPSGKYRNAIHYISPNSITYLPIPWQPQNHSNISPEEDPNKIWKKFIQIKIFVFEITKVKVH